MTKDDCNILWEVVKNQQTITMKVCVEPQSHILANISLQNTEKPSLNVSLKGNYTGNYTSNYTENYGNYTENYGNYAENYGNYTENYGNYTENYGNYSNYTNIGNYTTGTTTGNSTSTGTTTFNEMPKIDETISIPTLRGKEMVAPSASTNITSTEPNVSGLVFVITFTFILVLILMACFLRIRHKKKLKVPFKKEVNRSKYTSTVAPDRSIKRPKDYAIEYIGETKRQMPKHNIPHPPSRLSKHPRTLPKNLK